MSLYQPSGSIWDASGNRIGKAPGAGGLFNLSAGGWAAATLLLWIIGFPAYLFKRATLLERAKTNPVEIKGRIIKGLVLFVIGGVWLVITLAFLSSPELPACAAPVVVGLADQSVRNAPKIKELGIEIVGVVNPAEESFDAAKGRRICRATLKSSRGEEPLRFSVEWQDKSKGIIWVQILPQ